MNNRLFLLCIVVFAMVIQPFAVQGKVQGNPNKVTIIIEPVFNGTPLQLTDKYYINEHGDSLFIDLFRFYITNLELYAGDLKVKDANAHLVDAENTATQTFSVAGIASGSYTSVRFTLGVDSIANKSGANSGDLDPTTGMYWAWNSGYIMAKLEGRSKVCKTLHHAFEFHIGGYMPPYNAARLVELQLPKGAMVTNESNTTIRIKADAAAWFSGKLDLATFNNVVIPGKEANLIADKYARMFSVIE